MQIDSNNRLKQRVLAGKLDQNRGRALEQACIRALAAYDRDECPVEAPLDALAAYDCFLGEPDRQGEYWRTLHDRPWRSCPCGICADVGIQVVIFRGTERNKRRGFHNLFVFNHLLHKTRTRMSELRVPALRLTHGAKREIYSFGIDGGRSCTASLLSRASGATTTQPSADTSDPRYSHTSMRSAPTSSRSRR